MTLLVPIRTTDTGIGRGTPGKIAADRLLEGDPDIRTWQQDEVEGKVQTGMWEMTPGMNRSIKGDLYEYCHILAGLVEITPEGGVPQRFGPGDHFVMKPGFVGTWRTIETVRKIYVIIG